MTWDEKRFFPAFKRAGMLIAARVLYAGTDIPIEVDIGFCRPDMFTIPGVQSSDYEMEYQTIDLPSLREGDQVEIDSPVWAAGLYRVRQPKFVDGVEATGFFSKALLTKISGECAQ